MRFLTESKAVYDMLERIVAEASHSECTPHRPSAAFITWCVAVAGCGLAASSGTTSTLEVSCLPRRALIGRLLLPNNLLQ